MGTLTLSCQGGGERSEIPENIGEQSPSKPAGTSESAPPTLTQQVIYDNPVFDQQFADPGLMLQGNIYYAYATGGSRLNVPVARSSDLTHWDIVGDAMPTPPPWAETGLTWAPEAFTFDGGQTFLLYFSARDPALKTQCVGVARAHGPEGPFESAAVQPLVCNPTEGGAIDPTTFTDAQGQHYLIWKNDGNSVGKDTWLNLQPLSADGTQLTGSVTPLIKQTLPWEGPVVEAPTLLEHDSHFYLFYSANVFSSADYSVGWATATTLTGPYEKHDTPLLTKSDLQGPVSGPGGQSVVVGPDGRQWMAYASWNPQHTFRALSVQPLLWDAQGPTAMEPTWGIRQ